MNLTVIFNSKTILGQFLSHLRSSQKVCEKCLPRLYLPAGCSFFSPIYTHPSHWFQVRPQLEGGRSQARAVLGHYTTILQNLHISQLDTQLIIRHKHYMMRLNSKIKENQITTCYMKSKVNFQPNYLKKLARLNL